MSDLRQALESALLDSPDDRATCAAHADFLAEQGDPRGEFIQTQLALEDASTAPAERKKLRAREKRLLKKHERDWLGDLARWLLDGDASDLQEDYGRPNATYSHSWRRGFLDRVEAAEFSTRFAQALATRRAARLLRELLVENDSTNDDYAEMDPPPPRTPTPSRAPVRQALYELIGAPCLRNLRVFQMGEKTQDDVFGQSCFSYTPCLEAVIEGMPRIEELYLFTKSYDAEAVFGLPNLTNLRVLQAHHLQNYPLEILAANPALANLASLCFHPHHAWPEEGVGHLPLSRFEALLHSPHIRGLTHLRFRQSSMGDDGVRLLIESGWLKRLKVLDLQSGCVTDEGARLLAACPDLKNLESLDLSRNQLTVEGVRVMQRAKVPLRCEDQAAEGSTQYLGDGDFE